MRLSTITTTIICSYLPFFGVSVFPFTHFYPPRFHTCHCTFCRIWANTNTNPSGIFSDIINPLWRCFGNLRRGKIVPINLQWVPFFTPRFTRIFIISDSCFFLGIHWNYRWLFPWVSEATGIARRTLHAGLNAWSNKKKRAPERIRDYRGGRKRGTDKAPKLLSDREHLLATRVRGDPESSLCWTCKSTRPWADALNKNGNRVRDRNVCALLSEVGYRLPDNCKTNEGKEHPDREDQFLYLYKKATSFPWEKPSIISVDTKKKAGIGLSLIHIWRCRRRLRCRSRWSPYH